MSRTWRNALLLLFLCLLLPGASFGETFTVTKTEDDDGPCLPEDCALREAILAANALPGEDRIFLPVGVYPLTIPGTQENESRTGDLDILEDLVIGGPTPTHALLDASPAIDTANDAECEPNDQRGFPRPQDGDGDGVAGCDVGAVEFVPTADSVLPTVIPTLDGAGLAALALLLVLAGRRFLS